MADNVLQNIGQGLQSFLTGTPLSQIQNQAEQQRIARQQQFMQLDDQRKSAMFQDARTVNSFLKSGQPTQALNVLSNRLSLAAIHLIRWRLLILLLKVICKVLLIY